MELEEAIEILKSYENKLVYEISEKDKEAVVVVLNHLTKQEKMIELMLEEMTDCEFEMNCSNCNCECERDYDQLYSCNREYFEKKAEESE